MVMLNFNLYGYLFQRGVDGLASGFRTATAAVTAERDRIEPELSDYEASVAAGGSRIGEWEDGHKLWEQDDMLRMQVEDATASLADLRKAYVLAIYHHWERNARRWTGHPKVKDHNELAALSVSEGNPLDSRLRGLCDLVNLLKHNNDKLALKLVETWPDVLSHDPRLRPGMDWYACVALDDARVLEACDIIRGSGPTTDLYRQVDPIEVGAA